MTYSDHYVADASCDAKTPTPRRRSVFLRVVVGRNLALAVQEVRALLLFPVPYVDKVTLDGSSSGH
ncbi:MAG: hypothetical protein VYA50_07950, partial [Chloroflexota bacterium]|nr:hypothetical protein [Chloroflexota bacterium]